ncbi:MAG: tetratricopeptide repeat protein, partial [Phycisphaerales bacterium]|nr:tetratricopeptide repeat protein [Phycisphaerales bacterium]
MIRRLLFLLLLMMFGCGDPGSSAGAPSASAMQENNRGVGLMGSFDYNGAFMIFNDLAEAYPDWTPVLINREIARLNRQQADDELTALEQLSLIAERTGDVRARYMAGLLQFNQGDLLGAYDSFQSVVDSDPSDAYALYYLGQVEQQRGETEQALVQYEGAMELDPYLRSAIYGASLAARRTGKVARADELLELFQALEDNPRARLAEIKYTRMGPKAMALVVDQEDPVAAPAPEGSLFSTPATIAGAYRFTSEASCTASDIDGDGDIDVFV